MKQNGLFLFFLLLTVSILFYSIKENEKIIAERKNQAQSSEVFDGTSFDKRRNEYMYNMVKDPVTGRIPDGIIEKSYRQALLVPEKKNVSRIENLNTYLAAGANNAGGRSRTVVYDKRFDGNTNRVIIAGAVSGGIFRSADGGSTWTLVTATGQIHNVHWIVQDISPGRENRWYAGGGEHWGNSTTENGATFMSDAMYGSVDNGITWTRLTQAYPTAPGPFKLERFDHPFDFVHKIAINPINGDLYVGCHRRLMRSIDGGTSWQVVMVGTKATTADVGTIDVVISNTGKIYAAVNGGNNDKDMRGIWTSTTGSSGSFTRIAGGGTLGVDSVLNWRGNSYDSTDLGTNGIIYSPRRILLALAPSNNNIMYVIHENGASSGPDIDFYKVDLTTNTWTNRSANMPDYPGGNSAIDPFQTQGGYDMLIAVKPNDPNFVILGGVNLFRSTDGFASTANTTWIGGYGDQNGNPFLYPNHHPDQHVVAFRPDNSNILMSGHDGGLSVTNDITAGTVVWSVVPNYQTFQYYYVAIDPGTGRNNFAGGLQDNGTWLRDRVGILGTASSDSNNHRFIYPALSGDGGAVGLAANVNGQQYLYGSSQLGTIKRVSLPNINLGTSIKPNGLTANPGGSGFGEFITNFRLNLSNTNDLFYINFNRLFRTTDAANVDPTSWTELTGVSSFVDAANDPSSGIYIRSLAFSWGPYQSSHVMYLGTTDGRILRLDDPRNALAAQAPVNISIPGLPFGANIQDIAVNPNNDHEIMAVVSNYEINSTNVVSVWWTNNAKSATPTWVNAEGSLITAASVRSCAIVVKKDAGNNPVTEYYIGTSVGLFSVTDNTPSTPPDFTTWAREGSTIFNLPVVQSLAYRPVDNVLLIGTHGNGMYFTYLGTPNYTPNQPTAVNNPVINDKNFISKVYPTVTSSNVVYKTGNMYAVKKINIVIYNNSGQEVYKTTATYQQGTVDLTRLSKGVYYLSISTVDKKFKHLQKIIRQ
jgi:hypothetical protein